MKLDYRQRLLSTTLLVGANLIAVPAMAQDVQPTEPPSTDVTSTPTGPVEGQPIPATSATGEPVDTSQDIVVTGSRIPQPNLESAAPVTVVNTQDIKLSGATRIDDIIAQLPSAAAPQGPGLPNPATGTAELDLRYLGAKRTLTLVNGRRLSPGDPNNTTQAGDVNMIPASILKRVEVLTGGASSVYGADAVAGVVNFIMDTDFNGIRFDGNVSSYQHNNNCPSVLKSGFTVCDLLDQRIDAGFEGFDYPKGSGWDGFAFDGTISVGAGFDDGRGHAMAYFGYRKQNEILQADRDYSACNINGSTTASCGGSSFSAEGNFLLYDNFYTRGPNGTLLGPGQRTRYNYAPLNHWIRPDERYTAGAFADYEITPAIKPYLEFMFMDDETRADIAPSGNFASTTSINCDNPFLSAQAHALVCERPGNLVTGFLGTFPLTDTDPDDGQDAPLVFFDALGTQYQRGFMQIFRRNVEGGPRSNNLKHTTYRGVLGTRGDLSSAFSYDAYYQYGKTNYTQVYRNEFSASRLARSINVVDDPRTPEFDPICRSVLDGSDPNCVPYNYFDSAGPSQAAVDYHNIFGVIEGATKESIANINFTGAMGELGWQTPWARDGIGINVGYEYRKEMLELNPDQSFQTNDLVGQGAPTLPVNGDFKVNELFAETSIPLVQDNFVYEFTLGAGYRKSWYKLSNDREYDTDTYKISAELAPIRDVRLRGSYNRAVRAPNIQELFAPNFVGLIGSTEPCAFTDDDGNPIPVPADAYGCIRQLELAGVADPLNTIVFANPSAQYNALTGGNPNLVPEKATTKTAGVVLQPAFIPRLAVTIDYWNIKLDKAIQGFGPDTILADCVANSTASAPAPSCDLVHRDPGGSLWLTADGYVIDPPNNVGKIKTAGWDFNAGYSFGLGGLGAVSTSFLGTWLRKYEVNNGIAPTYDCAGFYGTVCSGLTVASSTAMPKWRHKWRTTLEMPFGLGVSLNWRMVGKVDYEANSSDVALAAPFNPLIPNIKAQHYFDLAATYTMFDKLNLRAGVNNIFDNDPPIVPTQGGSCPASSCAGNTYPGTWDYLGRYFWAGATLTFEPRRAPPPPPPVVAPPPPPPPPPATQTCPDGSVILATETCPVPPPPPPPPPPAPERG